MLKFSLTTH